MDTALKRLLKVCAWVSSNCREATSPGLAAAVCKAEKNAVRTELIPVSRSASSLSMLVIWSWKATESACSEVAVCSWLSRYEL
ncbi:hypothetical protein D3C80_1923230 [compost metagenome]